MRVSVVMLLVALILVVVQASFASAVSSTVPAFLWSHDLSGVKEVVDYRVLSPRELAKSVMVNGGWSEHLCSEVEDQQSQKFAFIYIGKELNSMDVTVPSVTDTALVNLLKETFSNSNSSLAFPYLTAAETAPIESLLISEFGDNCGHTSDVNKIVLVGSCHVQGEVYIRLSNIQSLNDYLNSRTKNSKDGCTDLIVLCGGGSTNSPSQSDSEGSILSQLVNTVSLLGVKYSVLYVSDPYRYSTQSVSHSNLARFLAESTVGNISSLNSTTCDAVCQTKASLLEGALVGLVLLIILISGLCCMMGIDTPTRFETPQDS